MALCTGDEANSETTQKAVCALQITSRKIQSVFETIISLEKLISNYKGW
jgi:hypothetical protein